MIYTITGETLSRTTSGTAFKMPVHFIAKLEDTNVTGEYLIYGGVPIESVTITPYTVRCIDQETYLQFANHVALLQREVNEHVVVEGCNDLDASVCQLFADNCVMLLAKMRIALSNQRTNELEKNSEVEQLWSALRAVKVECKNLVK